MNADDIRGTQQGIQIKSLIIDIIVPASCGIKYYFHAETFCNLRHPPANITQTNYPHSFTIQLPESGTMMGKNISLGIGTGFYISLIIGQLVKQVQIAWQK